MKHFPGMLAITLNSEIQYQAEQSMTWEVCDLYQFPTGRVLCIAAGHTFAYFITAEGMTLVDVQIMDVPKDTYLLHNTGLDYQYQNKEQVQRDYEQGLFTPYFEIL